MLNAVTKGNAYPMPSISDLIQRLAHRQFYAVFDWTSGFHQLRVDSASQDCTTFVVPNRGLFRFLRMPFGVKNGPPVFQARMESCYAKSLHRSLEIFVDDHTVYADTWPQFLKALRDYFNQTRAVSGRLKGKKSEIGAKVIHLLGQQVSAEGVSISPERKDELRNLAYPTTPSELQTLNGFLQYFRRFIPNYGTLADPLFKALKVTPFAFGPDCQKALATLKDVLTSDAVLHHIDYDLHIILRTDASNVALVECSFRLTQTARSNRLHTSRSGSKAPRRTGRQPTRRHTPYFLA